MDRIVRRLKHLMRSGCVVIGLEHFLVMFPSAMLIAKLSYTPYGAITELPEILLASGIGTLLFILLTRGAVPFFLGPSFAYIGFLSFHVAKISGINNVAQIRETIFLGYLISGIYLMALSFLYKYDIVKRIIKTIFPSTVMGPAISLIGLELANMAARDSGLIGDSNVDKMLSTITLLCIIVFSLLRHHFFQNASILIGVVMGCIIATVMGVVSWPPVSETVIAIPKLNLINVNLKSHNLITLV